MASDSPKGFIVVECQKPANGTLKRVCVPRSWVICTLIPDKMVCIVYPDEEMSRTAERLMNNEPKGEGWRSYIGEIMYEAESFLDACYGYIRISGNRNIEQHLEEDSIESFLDACYGYIRISGNQNIEQHLEEDSIGHVGLQAFIASSELASQRQEPLASTSSSVEVTLTGYEAPQTSIISPKLESSEELPAADTEYVASRPAAVTPSPVELVTPEDTPVTAVRDSLKVKIRRKDYGWKSETSENMKKSKDKNKHNKHKAKKVEKRAPKENFHNLNVNTENTLPGSINIPEFTEVKQNKPGFEHIMTKRMELKIKDIMHSPEPELKGLIVNKTNSVVSKASLSENEQEDVQIKFRNFSPADKKLLVNLQNSHYETVEKIRTLQLQLNRLYTKANEDSETLRQLFLKYQDGPLEADPLERTDKESNMADNEMEAKEDDEEDDEEHEALIYEEDEEKVSEGQELERVSDTESIQLLSPPSSPELMKKNDRNNNRWTLKYKQPGKGLIQLGASRIYLSAFGLERCKRTCHDVKTFVRELYKEVFTREALSTCSMTGKKPNVGRTKRSSPALHCEAQSVILKYALNYSHKVGWDRVKRYSLLQTIRGMLLRLKNKRNREYKD